MQHRKPSRVPSGSEKTSKHESGNWFKRLSTGETVLSIIGAFTLVAALLIVPEVRKFLGLPREGADVAPVQRTPKPPLDLIHPETPLKFVPLPNAQPLPDQGQLYALGGETMGLVGVMVASDPLGGIIKRGFGTSLALIHKVEPSYPPSALTAHIEGEVSLRISVRPDGTVGDVKVLTGNPILAASAVAAVKQWRYRPPSKFFGKHALLDDTAWVTFTLRKR
jgi:TonB family protein